MRHQQIKRRLSAFLDGEVSEEEKQLISSHLESCEYCRQELSELSQISDVFSLIDDAQVSPYFISRLKQRIAEEKSKSHVRLPLLVSIKQAIVSVAAVALVIFSLVLGRNLGKAMCQAKINTTLTAHAEFTKLTGISSLDDLTEGSLTKTYFDLVKGKGE